jgi:hypothetical protein
MICVSLCVALRFTFRCRKDILQPLPGVELATKLLAHHITKPSRIISFKFE